MSMSLSVCVGVTVCVSQCLCLSLSAYHLYGYIDLFSEETKPLSQNFSKKSKVRIFKIHGSYGWMYVESRQLFYLKDQFLNHLYPKGMKERVFYHEEGPTMINPTDFLDVPFIFPTYLKSLEDPLIQQVWGNASMALLNADEVVIVGYSLPLPDMAVRALLMPLANRVKEKGLKIRVVDPCQETLKNWDKFLGAKSDFIHMTAEDYFQTH